VVLFVIEPVSKSQLRHWQLVDCSTENRIERRYEEKGDHVRRHNVVCSSSLVFHFPLSGRCSVTTYSISGSVKK